MAAALQLRGRDRVEWGGNGVGRGRVQGGLFIRVGEAASRPKDAGAISQRE